MIETMFSLLHISKQFTITMTGEIPISPDYM